MYLRVGIIRYTSNEERLLDLSLVKYFEVHILRTSQFDLTPRPIAVPLGLTPLSLPYDQQLTVITISDHHTRVSTGGGAQEAGGRVIGLLFGSQNGLDVSIYDAMEVACTAVGPGGLELNEALVEKQKDLCELFAMPIIRRLLSTVLKPSDVRLRLPTFLHI